jgi:hypothetical protein
MPRTARLLISGLAAVAVTTLAACGSDSPTVAPPEPTGAAASACEQLDPALPETVSGETATATDPESPYTAAWNDVLLRCGTPDPDVDPTAQLISVEGVDWFPEELPGGGTRFTTVGLVANVAVDVPRRLRPEAGVLVDLVPAIAEHVPASDDEGAPAP